MTINHNRVHPVIPSKLSIASLQQDHRYRVAAVEAGVAGGEDD